MPRGGRRAGAGRKEGPTPRTRAIRARVQRDLELTAERTLEEIRRLSLSDIAHAFDEGGRLKPLHQMPVWFRACIASVKTTKKNLTAGDGIQEDVVEIKLWDKLRALEMAAKHHGLLIERVEVSGEMSLLEKVARARQRLKKPE